MPSQALTPEFMQSLGRMILPPKPVFFFDTTIRGFVLEFRASGSATYYFRYRTHNNKIKMCRIGGTSTITLQDARNKAHAMKQLHMEGGDPAQEFNRFKDIPTFDEFALERYLPYAKVKKRSWDSDVTLLKHHLLPVFSGQRLHRISRSDIISMHHGIREHGYAAGTANRILVLAKFIFNCAIRWGILPAGSNPCVGVELLPDNGARERFLTQSEVHRLFEELEHNKNTQVAQIIKILLYTGARKREILDATWDNIDMNRRILTVPLAKSGKPRYIPLSDAAMDILRELPREKDVSYVFFNKKTKRPLVSIFFAWDTIRKKVGLGDVRLHDLRHSFASFLVQNGESLYQVQKILGHHDPKITMRYAHLAPESLINAANVVGDVCSGKKILPTSPALHKEKS